jgi:pimeloyl-ACP methyl ester carboxylesterase
MKRILKRVLLAAVALAVCAVIAGFLFQQVANWRDGRRFPQQGKSVSLAPEFPEVFLNLDCSGSGSPTVIMDSGLGVPAVGWYQAQPEIAKFTRVCSYDRAGYGWSTPGPMPRTTDQIVKELHALLVNSGEKGPYVFLAHSFGGYNVRVYTARYPNDVAGLVLVDTSHEDQASRFTPGLQRFMAEETAKLKTASKFAPVLIYSGLARVTTGLDSPTKVSIDKRREFRYLQLQTKYVAATSSEMLNFDQSATQVRQAGNLGDRPLIVLTAGKISDEGIPKNLAQEMNAFHDLWVNDLQVKEAHLSTRGKQIIVPDSDHMIPIEQPQSIINATQEVVSAVRSAAASTAPAPSAPPPNP